MVNMFGGLLFGTIGFIAFIYGKRKSSLKAMGIGGALMAYPYFVSNTAIMYLVGIVLVAALFIFHN